MLLDSAIFSICSRPPEGKDSGSPEGALQNPTNPLNQCKGLIDEICVSVKI
jgi:hypothetical protein